MARHRHKVDENYIAFSDIMTCLMVIFLFIAISYIMEVFTSNFVKDDMYNTISTNMAAELSDRNVKFDKDLSLKFFNDSMDDSAFQFGKGQDTMSASFKQRIGSLWPKYQAIITRDTFLNYISEIRIEGHTDTMPPTRITNKSSYAYNLDLSARRAQDVLNYIQSLPCFLSLDSVKRERLEFLMTANGMSYSRALNDSGEVAYLSHDKRKSNDQSRRVEFRIVTTNQKLVESLLKR